MCVINVKFKRLSCKNIFIYVYGYKVVFENFLLIVIEFWYYFGYDGVMLVFVWLVILDFFVYFLDFEMICYFV